MEKREEEQQKKELQNGNPAQYPCPCHSHCNCCCQYQNQDAYLSHNPFLIRQCIVASGIIAGFFGSFLGWYLLERQSGGWYFFEYYPMECFPLLGLAFYFCCVTLGDGLSHFVLKLKPSSFSDASLLLKIEGVTGDELDHYCDTRRNIRMLSLAIATAVFGIFWCFAPSYALPVGCIAYILSTILGILFVRCTSSKRRPRIIRLSPSYVYPGTSPMSGYNYLLWQQGKLPYWW